MFRLVKRQIWKTSTRFLPDFCRTPDQCPDSRKQFRYMKRLYQIVVRTVIQPLYSIIQFWHPRNNNDRNCNSLPTHGLDNGHSVNDGEHTVNDCQIIAVFYIECVEHGGFPVMAAVNYISGFLQFILYGTAEFYIIFKQ